MTKQNRVVVDRNRVILKIRRHDDWRAAGDRLTQKCDEERIKLQASARKCDEIGDDSERLLKNAIAVKKFLLIDIIISVAGIAGVVRKGEKRKERRSTLLL